MLRGNPLWWFDYFWNQQNRLKELCFVSQGNQVEMEKSSSRKLEILEKVMRAILLVFLGEKEEVSLIFSKKVSVWILGETRRHAHNKILKWLSRDGCGIPRLELFTVGINLC